MIEIRFKHLQAENDGFDENDRWLGMTPEELTAWLEEVMQRIKLVQWEPDCDAS